MELQKEINTAEPRFYVYKFGASFGEENRLSPLISTVFIYCCPEKSPAKLRMVYSTSKPTVADSISKLGLSIVGKRVRVRKMSSNISD